MVSSLQNVDRKAMGELFELVFEYRSLLARREVSEHALNLPERRRLDALARLLGCEPKDVFVIDDADGGPGRRSHARCEVTLHATLRSGGVLVRVEVTNMGAGGVCVTSSEPLDVGARGALRIRTANRAHECLSRVAWVGRDGRTAGLRFVGAPIAFRMAAGSVAGI